VTIDRHPGARRDAWIAALALLAIATQLVLRFAATA
jgi:hypothetical protein